MSKFPNGIDTDAELPSVIDGSTEIAGDAINAQKDALLQIERTIGINPQGTAATLSDRLDVSINPDGTLNSAAIASAWLLSSPITNAHVSTAAAIDESKINLDVSTSTLQDQITDIAIDVEALQDSVGNSVATLAGHITGTDDRHIAQHIIVSPAVAGGTSGQTALQNIYTALNDHIADTSDAHAADSISYSPAPGSNLTANSVGGALDEIDSNFINRVNRHLDTAHSNGISADGYVCLGGQGASNAASFGAVPIQPLGGQPRLKIGGINHATLVSRGANPAALGSSASSIIIDYSDGHSLYTVTVTGLNLSPYPVGTENRLRGVVSKINEALRSAGALVTAFPFKNELALQHNTPDGYLLVRAPSIASATSALGFSAVVGQRVNPISHFVSVTDGIPIDGWTPLTSGSATISGPSLVLTLPSAVEVGSLVHVTGHTALGGGTYQVVAATGSTVTLNRPIAAGTFSYRIFPDSVDLGALNNGTTYELFVNSAGQPVRSARASIVVPLMSGIRISECSLQPGTYSISISGSGANRSLFLASGSNSGEPVVLSQGYIGQVLLSAPRGLGTAIIDVVSLAPPSPASDTFSVVTSAQNDDLQKICSFWSDGTTCEFPVDLRNLGLVNKTSLATDVFSEALAAFPSNRWNGFISGDAPIVSGVSVQVSASRFMLSGVVQEIHTSDINFAVSGLASDTYNIYIDLAGSLRIASESGAGTSLQSIIARGEIPLARAIYDGSTIALTDTRLFSLPVPPLDRLLVGGSTGTYHCPDISGALLISAAGGFSRVVAQSDQSTALDIAIPDGTLLEGSYSLTCRTLSVGVGASVHLDQIVTTVATPTITGITAANTGRVSAKNIQTRSVSLADYSSLNFLSCQLTGSSAAGIVTLALSGAGVLVSGLGPGASMSFALGGTVSITSATELVVQDFVAVFDSTELDWISLSGTSGSLTFDRFSAHRSGLISALDIQNHRVFSNTGMVESFLIDSGSFEECGCILRNAGTISFASITSCSGSNFGGIFKSEAGSSSPGVVVSEFYGYRMYGNLIRTAGATGATLSDSVFYGTFGGSQTIARAFYANDSGGAASSVAALISKCTFSGIAFQDYFIAAENLNSASKIDLSVSGCSFASVISGVSQSARLVAAGNLVNWTARTPLRIDDCNMTACSFKIATGYNFELTKNTIQLTTAASQLQLFNTNRAIISTDPEYSRPLARLEGNSISITGNSTAQFSSTSLYGNEIIAGEFIFDYGVSDAVLPVSAGYMVVNNTFESLSTTADSSFVFYPGYSISSNKFSGKAVANLIKLGFTALGNGFLKFSNNICDYLAPAGAEAIVFVDDNLLTSIKYTLDGNIIRRSGPSNVDNCIQIAPNNVACSNNYIIGEGIAGTIFRGAGGSTQRGCRIIGNIVVDAIADGTDLASDGNSFEDNRGLENGYSLSPFNALFTNAGQWAFGTSTISSNSPGAVMWVPISVPSGELVEAGVNCSFASGTVTLQLYSMLGAAATLVGSATISPSPSAFGSVTPTTAPFIGAVKTAALKITTSNSGVTIGNIRAVVKL